MDSALILFEHSRSDLTTNSSSELFMTSLGNDSLDSLVKEDEDVSTKNGFLRKHFGNSHEYVYCTNHEELKDAISEYWWWFRDSSGQGTIQNLLEVNGWGSKEELSVVSNYLFFGQDEELKSFLEKSIPQNKTGLLKEAILFVYFEDCGFEDNTNDNYCDIKLRFKDCYVAMNR